MPPRQRRPACKKGAMPASSKTRRLIALTFCWEESFILAVVDFLKSKTSH
jgi:hypothetical protein